ncbi:MAG: hypothetical protein LBR51_04085, partial [Bacteroidales bacterium]|nr:hypothetical protein [Bacteroidales bacterium]
MKILYDSDIFLNQKAGGISRYFYELFYGLKHNGHDVKIAGRFVKNTYLLSNQQYRKAFFYDPTASFSAFNKIA